jgi:hypothetical protein
MGDAHQRALGEVEVDRVFMCAQGWPRILEEEALAVAEAERDERGDVPAV